MRTAWMLALLVGCAVDELPQGEVVGEGWFDQPLTEGVATQTPPPPGPIDKTLVLVTSPSAVRGGPVSATVTGAVPGQRIRLYGSVSGEGVSAVCPPALNHNCIEILRPFLLVQGVADAGGRVTFNGTVPAGATSSRIWFEAVGLRDTNVRPNLSNIPNIPIVSPCADDDWWPGADLDGDGSVDLGHRVLVDVVGGSSDWGRAPVTVDVDFRAVLDAAGEVGSADLGSVRVVRQSCALDHAEVASQVVDEVVALDRKADHASPVGDDRAMVAFFHDDDDDPTATATLGAGDRVTYGVYFAAGAPTAAPTYATDLAVASGATVQLSNSRTSVTLDPARGGLMSAIAPAGSASLTSQTTSCCGNAMHYWDRNAQAGPPFGWITPQSAPAATEVLAEGPVVSIVRATGSRVGQTTSGQFFGSYDFEVYFWQFAGRPEVKHSLLHVATADSTTLHDQEASLGFRPLQLRHTAALTAGGATYVNDPAGRWGAVDGSGGLGIAIGLHQPPLYAAPPSNPLGVEYGAPLNDFYAVRGSEVVELGVPSPFTVPAGVAYFDNVGAFFFPYAGAVAGQAGEIDRVIEGVAAEVVGSGSR